jgi:hypothetical protein
MLHSPIPRSLLHCPSCLFQFHPFCVCVSLENLHGLLLESTLGTDWEQRKKDRNITSNLSLSWRTRCQLPLPLQQQLCCSQQAPGLPLPQALR